MMITMKKLKVPKRILKMRMTPHKLKVPKGIPMTKRLSRFHNRSHSRSATHVPACGWISTVKKSITVGNPKLTRPHHNTKSGSKNKKIMIIHNNTSITSNGDQDSRSSCVQLKEEITFFDFATPPPDIQASNNNNKEEEEEEEENSNEPEPETKEEEGMEIIRIKEDKACIHIQSAFRGHLARRAYRAVRGLVRLQAVVRGARVRRQARIALQCMNTLVRLQGRVQTRQLLH